MSNFLCMGLVVVSGTLNIIFWFWFQIYGNEYYKRKLSQLLLLRVHVRHSLPQVRGEGKNLQKLLQCHPESRFPWFTPWTSHAYSQLQWCQVSVTFWIFTCISFCKTEKKLGWAMNEIVCDEYVSNLGFTSKCHTCFTVKGEKETTVVACQAQVTFFSPCSLWPLWKFSIVLIVTVWITDSVGGGGVPGWERHV